MRLRRCGLGFRLELDAASSSSSSSSRRAVVVDVAVRLSAKLTRRLAETTARQTPHTHMRNISQRITGGGKHWGGAEKAWAEMGWAGCGRDGRLQSRGSGIASREYV